MKTKLLLLIVLSLPCSAQILSPIMQSGSASAGGTTFINSASTSVTGCAAAATSCALTYSPGTGNQLYIGIVQSSGQVVTSVTDNGAAGGSSYSSLFTRVSVNSGQAFLSIYCTASAAASVTTITSNGGGQAVMALEFTGDAIPCTVDKSNLTPHLSSATTSWTSSATAATTNTTDIALGFNYDVTTQNPVWTGTNGYTCLNGSYNAFIGNGNTLCYKILNATGAQTATGTTSTTDSSFAIITVVE